MRVSGAVQIRTLRRTKSPRSTSSISSGAGSTRGLSRKPTVPARARRHWVCHASACGPVRGHEGIARGRLGQLFEREGGLELRDAGGFRDVVLMLPHEWLGADDVPDFTTTRGLWNAEGWFPKRAYGRRRTEVRRSPPWRSASPAGSLGDSGSLGLLCSLQCQGHARRTGNECNLSCSSVGVRPVARHHKVASSPAGPRPLAVKTQGRLEQIRSCACACLRDWPDGKRRCFSRYQPHCVLARSLSVHAATAMGRSWAGSRCCRRNSLVQVCSAAGDRSLSAAEYVSLHSQRQLQLPNVKAYTRTPG